MDLSDVDLRAIVERDLGPGQGSPPAWCCPFHDDHDPSLKLWPDVEHWRCFGCGAHGDAIDWLQERRGLSFKAACEALDLELDGDGRPARPERPTQRRAVKQRPEPPGEVWREAAEGLVSYAQARLWSDAGADALAYLRNARGLTDETIQRWELGLYDRHPWRDPEKWGLEEGEKFWLPEGITIPWRVDGVLWFVNIRRLKDGHPLNNPKYVGAKAGRRPLYGIDHLADQDTVFVCEGEFDALLLWQEAGDLVDVVALGGAKHWPDVVFLARLAGAPRWYVTTDLDDAGEEGALRWRRYSGRVERVGALQGNDLTDFWRQEGDLRAWVQYHQHADRLAALEHGRDAVDAGIRAADQAREPMDRRLDAVEVDLTEQLEAEAEGLLDNLQEPSARQRYAEIADALGWPCWGMAWSRWARGGVMGVHRQTQADLHLLALG